MNTNLVWLLGLMLGGIMILVLVLARLIAKQDRLSRRLMLAQRGTSAEKAALQVGAGEWILRVLRRMGATLTGSGLLSARTVSELEQTLQSAGFRGDRALTAFVGGKLLSLVCLPALVWFGLTFSGQAAAYMRFALPAAFILGMLLPDLVAKQLRKRYLAELERGLPDAMDLMVICAEAGLALETTVERVAREIAASNPAIATEFSLCNTELRILNDRRMALVNMAERTRLEQFRRLGTPLVQALRTLSAELRQEQLTRFEARAARLPVLLTVPMIAFILPTLIIVAAGPALIAVIRLL